MTLLHQLEASLQAICKHLPCVLIPRFARHSMHDTAVNNSTIRQSHDMEALLLTRHTEHAEQRIQTES